MQARIHPADPETLPPDVASAVHFGSDFNVYYARDLTQSPAARRTYVEAAVTAGLQRVLRDAARGAGTA